LLWSAAPPTIEWVQGAYVSQIPECFRGGLILTYRPTLSTNQVRPSELLITDMCPYSLEINISSSFLFCTSVEKTVENVNISRAQLAPCQQKQIERQKTGCSAGCKVLAPNAVFPLATIPFFCIS